MLTFSKDQIDQIETPIQYKFDINKPLPASVEA